MKKVRVVIEEDDALLTHIEIRSCLLFAADQAINNTSTLDDIKKKLLTIKRVLKSEEVEK